MGGTRFQGFRASAQPPAPQAAVGERRRAPRIPWEVQFSSGRLEGTGILRDLSVSGAHIMALGIQPAPGEPARLYFSTCWTEEPLVVVAKVTRRTDSGFAVRFCEADPRLIAAGLGLLRPADLEDEPRVFAEPEPFECDEELTTAPTLLERIDSADRGADCMVLFPGYMDESEPK